MLTTPNNTPYRKARTRTLIQLGGLIEKSGLLKSFGIVIGDNLQQDLEKKEQVFALLGALLAMLLGSYAIYSYIFKDTISGWTSLATIITFFSSLQLICIGVIGEYIGRTYIQTKERVIRTGNRRDGKAIGRLSVIVDGQTSNKFPEASTGLSVQLDDGRWLNAKVAGLESPPVSWENWAPLFVTGLLLAIVVISVVHLETRPLKALARAADQLGRGEKLAPLHETGPKETRAALRAFNQMGDKISRFVGDRTQMLAAMSHDLRTPLTSMRLRIEDVEDEDLREKLVASIDEMKHMSEAVLAFARADAADEPTALTDLGQLAGCVVSEYKEMDQPVTLGVVGDTQVHVRPMAMKRALRNLIENAVRYGYSAKVSLVTHDGQAIFEISDEGSGIAETDMERVFEPFIRLETSRNRETGGAGLGLAITRSIVRSHGGELTLENQTNGGLLARIRLFTARS